MFIDVVFIVGSIIHVCVCVCVCARARGVWGMLPLGLFRLSESVSGAFQSENWMSGYVVFIARPLPSLKLKDD